VSLVASDHSANTLNIGDGNGKVTLTWNKGDSHAKVRAWVNGAIGKVNKMVWTVYAFGRY